ncbi:MAG TPA: hypothetical protein VEY87_06150 [Gaiellaceae bacterium]|jgi:hypothetical protein|nr:hypothetical protein [Gaiellaceae bacterium]
MSSGLGPHVRTKGDGVVDGAAAKLEQLSRKAAAKGGLTGKLAEELADDAAFVRKLKPSLIAARARGESPTDLPPGTAPRAPSVPQLGPRPRHGEGEERNPLVVVGAAFATGIALAKLIDWRGHAHPRRR